ncbi:MAG: NTP transferase domain-containing protein [Oscillospiraceae bacterium]|nr:NTP transferase domain-containing protein [Oscillospiraceae bacterium]
MKNNIEITGSKIVSKHFHGRIACEKEKYILNLLQGTDLVPRIISCGDFSVSMDFIPGRTVSQLVADSTVPLEKLFRKLSDWVLGFNRLTENIVLDDMNPRNFIFSPENSRITGIDFESWHNGDSTENLASVLVMILSVCFPQQEKDRLYSVINDYICTKTGISADILQSLAEKGLRSVNLRRRAMKNIRQTDCVIIAGGKSSRMGSPKGLLEYKGHSFTDHIIYNTAVFDRQYISANTDEYNDFNCGIIKDIHKDCGPPGALQAALSHCKSRQRFFIPCDMPFDLQDTVIRLFTEYDGNADAVVVTDGEKVYPTLGIYKKSALPYIENQLKKGDYRLMHLLDKMKTVYIKVPYSCQLKNINTKEEYSQLK